MKDIGNALRMGLGLLLAGATLVFMTAVGLAVLGIALVVGIGMAVAMKLSGPKLKPVQCSSRRNPRVWNDGRGTIIDM